MEHSLSPDDAKRIDTVIVDTNLRPIVGIEFKYDKRIPGPGNLPRTQKAGSVFKDMARLLRFPCVERAMIHLSDRECAGYWRNPANGLQCIFDLAVGGSQLIEESLFRNRSSTLQRSMGGGWPQPAIVTCLASTELPHSHHLRIYGIDPAPCGYVA